MHIEFIQEAKSIAGHVGMRYIIGNERVIGRGRVQATSNKKYSSWMG